MGVNEEIGETAIRAASWHGIIRPAGYSVETSAGPEEVFEYVPLPPGPTEHWTDRTPEELVGYTEVLCPRGLLVRLVDNTDRRNLMQGTGGTRLRVKRRDAAYHAMEDAKRKRAVKEKEKRDARNQHREVKF